jgi:endonuclease YncB( thermonuclease family)
LKRARLLLATLVLAVAGPALAEGRRCLVVGVSDGDTINARCGEQGSYEQIRVRLAGIDAPERRQAYGERARQHLAGLAFQRWAELECGKGDRYGRSVCLVRVAPASRPDGPPVLDVGLSMVSAGMAVVSRLQPRAGPGRPRQVRGGRAGRQGPARGPVGRSWPGAAVGVAAITELIPDGRPAPEGSTP